MSEKGNNTPKSAPRKSQSKRTSERRKQITAIVMMVFALLILLSIISYADHDEAILDKLSVLDIVRVPFDESVKIVAEGVQNHLGLIGAWIANFFVVLTFGYASATIPLLMIVWSWVLLARKNPHKPLTLTNYLLLATLLFSTASGLLGRLTSVVTKEWTGLIGAYAADVMIHLLGTVGSLILIGAAFFITIVLAIDLDLQTSAERLEALWDRVRGWWRDRAKSSDGEGEDPDDETLSIRREEIDEPVRRVEPRSAVVITPHLEPPLPEVYQEENVSTDAGDLSVPLAAQRERRFGPAGGDTQEPEDAVAGPEEEIDYTVPSMELLDPPRQGEGVAEDELKANAELVRAKLAKFGVEIEKVSVTPGPVITLYELVPASGVKISRIVSLADDLALALAAKGIRIMAPIPGKSAVGVEIPNRNPSMVSIRSVLSSPKFRESKAQLPIALGKTIAGDVFVDDLTRMPHLLIAGATGSGKSVGINTILASLLFRLHPSDVKFVIIDPKKIELTLYGQLNHHFLAVSPDLSEEIITTPESAVSVLKSVELEMEKRYDRLAAGGVRNILDYNERFKAGRFKDTETIVHRKMPYLVVVIDELADLMMTAAREVEEPIARLAQLARAVGIHLVLATQRPSVDVITGVIKANFPARIAYQVASKTDSRTILDMNGADQLLGSGDMLYLPAGSPKPMRIQNAFITTEEVERLTEYIARQQGFSKRFLLPSMLEKKRAGSRGSSDERDEFFEEAARLIVRHHQGSVSLLQRRLKVGYSRAARLVDELEAAGIVGPFDGSKARLVLVDSDDQLDRILETLA